MRPCTRLATVQVHASRYCNLRCTHCYSTSGPEWRAALPPALLIEALGAAHAQGYRRLSFSGGEPLLYRGLVEVLDAARQLGMLTSLTTNGIPMLPKRLAALAPDLDLIAVSLDGAPERHDALRGPGAFRRMAARLPALRASGIPFGFLFTLSEASLHDLAWVAEFALEHGAALLQIHPLEQTGRAAAGPPPDDLIANAAYLAYLRLDALIGDRIALQLDLAHRAVVQAEPWRVYADPAAPAVPEAPLAERLDTLVIEDDGTVMPLQYGLPRALALGSLLTAPLGTLMAGWTGAGEAAFRAHCRRVLDRSLADPAALPAFNWFEALGQAA
jgi:MoaA/NifB/PqqE/SkfB family radical SAM enzyme